MENPRPEKIAVVDEVRERLESSSAAILTEYRGLKVKDISDLRRSLRSAGGEYKIYKNTLVRFAARDLGLDELESLLEGPTAIAFVEGDAAAVAKSLRDYSRTNPLLIVKGGVLGTKVMSAAETTALADLPSREVLLARLAGGMAAPMQQLAGLLQALPRNMAYGLKALIEKGGASPQSSTGEAAASSPPPSSSATSSSGDDAAATGAEAQPAAEDAPADVAVGEPAPAEADATEMEPTPAPENETPETAAEAGPDPEND
jgi:large subunit ribosomal protein L10